MVKKEFSKTSFIKLGNALQRLGDVIHHPEIDTNEFIQDSCVKRFEFSIEFFWKVLKKILLHEGVEALSPRDVIIKAFKFSLLTDEDLWLEMLAARNVSSHVYDQAQMQPIIHNIKTIYYPIMSATYNDLKKRVDSYA